MKFKIVEKNGRYRIVVEKFGSYIEITGIGSSPTWYETAEQARAAILDNVKSAEEVSE